MIKKQKYKGQRINGWLLGMAIYMWIGLLVTTIKAFDNSDFIWELIMVILGIVFTKLSFEDIK